jgi:hypothetical protein
MTMTKSEWEEIKSERRQLWCEVLLISMQNTDPMLASESPTQMADKILEEYDKKFASDQPVEKPRKSRAFKIVSPSPEESKR